MQSKTLVCLGKRANGQVVCLGKRANGQVVCLGKRANGQVVSSVPLRILGLRLISRIPLGSPFTRQGALRLT
jgi:hypothetical protein